MTFTVVRDTREQAGKGWMFRKTDECSGTLIEKLDVGDYSLKGFEKIITIERKGSVTEFVKNLLEKRFVGEFEEGKPIEKQSEFIRLEAIPYPFILLEFNMEEFLAFPHIPEVPTYTRKKIRFKGRVALKTLNALMLKYKTKVLFCGKGYGQEVALSIFKRFMENYNAKLNK